MICPVCGNNLPDGSTSCPVCGAVLQEAPQPQQGFDSQPQQNFAQSGFDAQPQQNFSQPGFDPDQGANPNPGYGVPAATGAVPGSNKKVVIGVVIAAVLLLVVGCVLFFTLGRGKKDRDGHYTSSYMGMVDLYIDLNGDKAKFGMKVAEEYAEFADDDTNQEFDCKATWSGNTLKLTVEGDTLECNYDPSNKTITIPEDSALEMGVELVFTKE